MCMKRLMNKFSILQTRRQVTLTHATAHPFQDPYDTPKQLPAAGYGFVEPEQKLAPRPDALPTVPHL